MKSALHAALVVALLAYSEGPLLAWNSFGHMVVASAAYRQLDSQTRSRVNKLLARNPYYKTTWAKLIPAGTSSDDRKRMIFMLAATWPDAIKSDAKYKTDGTDGGNRPGGSEASQNTGYDDFNRHKYWHFIDQPFTQDGTDLTGFQVPAPNAKTQIEIFSTVLQSSTASKDLKSYDLTWLLHLVGDVHQPLHASTRVSAAHPQGDAGGNDVGFCTATAKTCSGELHAFWDGILGTSTSVVSADQAAAALEMPTDAKMGEPASWIQDSFELSKTNVYVEPVVATDGPFHATEQYTTEARAVARRQVALAGLRLAAMLRTDLKPKS